MKYDQLGDYRLVLQLGAGAFGSSYLGEHIHSGTRVHIKVWPARTKQEVEDFFAEVRILAPLVHPNIIRVLDFGVKDEHTAFFVTTYAPYGTLRHHYRNGIAYPLTTVLPHLKQDPHLFLAVSLEYVFSW